MDFPSYEKSNISIANDIDFQKKVEQEWENSAPTRKEFENDYDTYFHFRAAEEAGHVRILGSPRISSH